MRISCLETGTGFVNESNLMVRYAIRGRIKAPDFIVLRIFVTDRRSARGMQNARFVGARVKRKNRGEAGNRRF